VFSSGIIPIAIAMPAPVIPENNQNNAPTPKDDNNATSANHTSPAIPSPVMDGEVGQDPTSMDNQLEDGCQIAPTDSSSPGALLLGWMLLLGATRRARARREVKAD
jgi:hypothetical protein